MMMVLKWENCFFLMRKLGIAAAAAAAVVAAVVVGGDLLAKLKNRLYFYC